MKAKEFMTTEVVSCFEDQTVADAAKIMAEKGYSLMPIVNKSGELVGIVTESDFIGKEINIPHALASLKQLFGQKFYFSDVETLYENAKKKKLSEVMTKDVKVIHSETTLTEIINLMIEKNLKRLPVVDEGTLKGIITRQNIIKAFNLAGS